MITDPIVIGLDMHIIPLLRLFSESFPVCAFIYVLMT